MIECRKSVTIITVTLNRVSLKDACDSVDNQTYTHWHHIVLGDGVLPTDYKSPKRSTLGFSSPIGATEPGANMRNGTPNPMLRWALKNLHLGEYFCFLDDDNQYAPDFLEKMVRKIEERPDVGIVLCGAEDYRYEQEIDGYPELARCDNSAFIARSELASQIEFPHASLDKNVVQDYEYIKLCSEKFGWDRVPEKLLRFGTGMNPPPERGEVLFLESWKLAQQAQNLSYEGKFDEAEKLFLDALSQYHRDAWSWKKLAELYIVTNKPQKAINAYDHWFSLYKEIDPNHVAAQFAYGQYLCYMDKECKDIFAASLLQRLKLEREEPNALEHIIYVFLTYVFLNNKELSDIYFEKCRSISASRILWAFNDALWTLKVYREKIEIDVDKYVQYFEGAE